MSDARQLPTWWKSYGKPESLNRAQLADLDVRPAEGRIRPGEAFGAVFGRPPPFHRRLASSVRRFLAALAA